MSSYKPGSGAAALLHLSTHQFWQSDGPQPHILNVHFFKMVNIRRVRVYLDFDLDESYTPTRMQFWAGTGEADLQMWGEERWKEPRGWLDINMAGVGGPGSDDESEDREDLSTEGKENDLRGKQGTLRCFLLQIRILENHQNGKDTHVRGLQVWAKDGGPSRMRAANAVGVGRKRATRRSAGGKGAASKAEGWTSFPRESDLEPGTSSSGYAVGHLERATRRAPVSQAEKGRGVPMRPGLREPSGSAKRAATRQLRLQDFHAMLPGSDIPSWATEPELR